MHPASMLQVPDLSGSTDVPAASGSGPSSAARAAAALVRVAPFCHQLVLRAKPGSTDCFDWSTQPVSALIYDESALLRIPGTVLTGSSMLWRRPHLQPPGASASEPMAATPWTRTAGYR